MFSWQVKLFVLIAALGIASTVTYRLSDLDPEIPSTYYLPCEVVSVNETSTYFGTVDQDVQMIYAAETGYHDWPDDVPYLLCMDSKGTKDVIDDEILVVWRTD